MIRKVKINEAVGMVLGHDVIRVVPGESSPPPFRRGHVVREEDIPLFLDMGKEHIYVVEVEEPEAHENEAAARLARAVAGKGVEFNPPGCGAVLIKAAHPGALKLNVPLLEEVNALGGVAIGTRHNWTPCTAEMPLAVAKTIPLYIAEAKLAHLEELRRVKGAIMEVKPFRLRKAGAVITGNEVFNGRIRDAFSRVIAHKIASFGATLEHTAIVPDDSAAIARAIREMHEAGCDVIFACGGMSVDPDDVTMDGIREAGAEVLMEGVPMMPSAVLGVALLDDVPVVGAPASVLRGAASALDAVLPMIFTGERPVVADIIRMGHGGFCLEKYAFPG